MSKENPLWGAPRIHGELLKLGFEIAESSVSKRAVLLTKPAQPCFCLSDCQCARTARLSSDRSKTRCATSSGVECGDGRDHRYGGLADLQPHPLSASALNSSRPSCGGGAATLRELTGSLKARNQR